ncbi:hypothetical protein M0812_17292 [Anaeramoeba flamelloides]|uniref:Uncharacterized protein n=1 Tax=Anaeramoeba flamelloides TaxID=1746091 RepID=A0AAV7Z7T4_9EUKA|nr:hypothetical protein M0812_17292 [Anaeramoeba flamelloides]
MSKKRDLLCNTWISFQKSYLSSNNLKEFNFPQQQFLPIFSPNQIFTNYSLNLINTNYNNSHYNNNNQKFFSMLEYNLQRLQAINYLIKNNIKNKKKYKPKKNQNQKKTIFFQFQLYDSFCNIMNPIWIKLFENHFEIKINNDLILKRFYSFSSKITKLDSNKLFFRFNIDEKRFVLLKGISKFMINAFSEKFLTKRNEWYKSQNVVLLPNEFPIYIKTQDNSIESGKIILFKDKFEIITSNEQLSLEYFLDMVLEKFDSNEKQITIVYKNDYNIQMQFKSIEELKKFKQLFFENLINFNTQFFSIGTKFKNLKINKPKKSKKHHKNNKSRISNNNMGGVKNNNKSGVKNNNNIKIKKKNYNRIMNNDNIRIKNNNRSLMVILAINNLKVINIKKIKKKKNFGGFSSKYKVAIQSYNTAFSYIFCSIRQELRIGITLNNQKKIFIDFQSYKDLNLFLQNYNLICLLKTPVNDDTITKKNINNKNEIENIGKIADKKLVGSEDDSGGGDDEGDDDFNHNINKNNGNNSEAKYDEFDIVFKDRTLEAILNKGKIRLYKKKLQIVINNKIKAEILMKIIKFFILETHRNLLKISYFDKKIKQIRNTFLEFNTPIEKSFFLWKFSRYQKQIFKNDPQLNSEEIIESLNSILEYIVYHQDANGNESIQLQLILLDRYLVVKTKANSLKCKYRNVKLNHFNGQDQTIVNLKLINPVGTPLKKVSFSVKFSNLGTTNEFVNLFNYNRDYSDNDDISKIRFQKKINYSFNIKDQNNDFKVHFLDHDRKFKNNGFIRFDFNHNQIIILIFPKITNILNSKNILNSYIIKHISNDHLLILKSQKFDEFIFLTSSQKRTIQLKEKMKKMKKQIKRNFNTNNNQNGVIGFGGGNNYNEGGEGGDEDNLSSIIKRVNEKMKNNESSYNKNKKKNQINLNTNNSDSNENDDDCSKNGNKTGNSVKKNNNNNGNNDSGNDGDDGKKKILIKEKSANFRKQLQNRKKPIVYQIEFLNNKLITHSGGTLEIYYNKRRLLIYQNQKSKYSIYLKPNSNNINITISKSEWDVIKLTYTKKKETMKKINWRIKFETLQQKNNFIQIVKSLTNYNNYKHDNNNSSSSSGSNNNYTLSKTKKNHIRNHNSDGGSNLNSKKQKRKLKKNLKLQNKELDLFEENTTKEKIYEFVLNDKGKFVEQGRIVLNGKDSYIKFLGTNTTEKIDFLGIRLWRSNNQPKVVSLNMSNYRNFTFVLFSKEIALDLFQNLHSIRNQLNN